MCFAHKVMIGGGNIEKIDTLHTIQKSNTTCIDGGNENVVDTGNRLCKWNHEVPGINKKFGGAN